ncbi:bactericidal permeability-increasing protein-like [Hyla sarda]|uniref:bactericidal permeability-increasing protein-like n=1 Tax=Hyla sarda TaxID=327740 RepID=UPI0024C3D683|nr:bactericidal permeability-increasing protein-like [Hyla sarda]
MALCVVLMGATYAGNPGFVVRITQKGLEYAREQGMTVLRQKLSTIHLPDYSGVYSGFMGKISKRYPARPIKLKILSPSAPSLAVKPGNLTLSPVLDIQAYAVLPKSALAPLFRITLSTHAVANVRVNSNRIVGFLVLNSIKIDLKHSDVGPFPVELLNLVLNYYISHILLPQVNEILANGYPLPLLDDVGLSNVVIKLHEHYLLLGADVKYG